MQSHQPDPDRLLTTEEVAARLGVPVDSVRFWRRIGRGPRGVRVGRHVRYRPEDLAAWLDANADPLPTSEAAEAS